ncbi:MAG TPA: hypothetical protein VFV08_08225 [Puia sp.]|nr:hypothetical protein [Puia sp.]
MKKALIFFGITVLIIAACSKTTGRGDNGPSAAPAIDCSTVTATFSADVNLIIQTRCSTNSGCHGDGSKNPPGPLLTYDQIFSSRIAIRYAVVSGDMPRGSKLSTIEIDAVACWVSSGAPAN